MDPIFRIYYVAKQTTKNMKAKGGKKIPKDDDDWM